MSSRGIRVIPDILRTLTFDEIGANYVAVGPVFEHPIRILSIKNLTDQNLVFSFNGVDDHELLAAHSGLVLDFTANSSYQAFPFIAAGTTIYVKDDTVAPTVDGVAISAYYCIGD